MPFGGARTVSGSPVIASTDLTYTGQRHLSNTGLMDYKARFYSASLGRFIQPDTLIPGVDNPQSWNRFSYVKNNPVLYTDPTGHRDDDGCRDYGCDFGTSGSTSSSSSYTPTGNPGGGGSGSDDDDECDINCELEQDDCWASIECRQEWANNVGAFATTLDYIAALLNGGYAFVGDLVIGVCAVCELGVLGFYQYFSVIPNLVSTASMVFWFAQGVLTGENSYSNITTSEGTTISVSLSQDTIVAVTTNLLGWTVLREPNLAFAVDAGVAAYDSGRSGAIPFMGTIPAWINPTITYNTNSGFDFSWQQ